MDDNNSRSRGSFVMAVISDTGMSIDGEKRLRRKIDLLPKEYQKELNKMLNKVGSEMVKDIRQSIKNSSGNFKEGPKGHWSSPPGTPPNKITGELMRSVKITHRSKLSSSIVTVDVSSFYGFFLEFGTIRMKARPFMRPGYRRNSPKATKGARKILKKVPKRMGNKK